MELHDLFESEETDRIARLQAVIAHGQIRYWLEHNADRLVDRLAAIPKGPFAGGYLMRSSLVDLDADYPDLVIIFVPKQTAIMGDNYVSQGGFFKKDGKSFIVIPCMIAAADTRYLSTRFGTGGKTSFIHEFIHYLMSKRKGDVKGSASHAEHGDMASYFNDPDEVNAYYQEAAQHMIEMMSAVAREAPEATKEWHEASTSDLIGYMKKSWVDKNFLSHASPKTLRALDKRMARFIETSIRPILAKANKKGGE